jgi:rubrerythrin
MSNTEQNLMDAFAGESQANRKYLAFAKKADQEGFPQVARIFRGAAAAETVHAHAHLKVLDGVRSTLENIKAAVEGEHYEFTKMYPGFIADAEAEGNTGAKRSFEFANDVEKVHHELYNRAKEAVEKGSDLPETEVHVCGVCGYTVEGDVPDSCPVCTAPSSKFDKVD